MGESNTDMAWLPILGGILVSIVLCHGLARRKGRKPSFWVLMGALFGPLAIAFLLLLHDRR